MRVEISAKKVQSDFVKKIEEVSGQDVLTCYQCGKCSAGCPAAAAMDLMPNQVIRLVQMGLEDEATKCQTIWLCASCLTCYVRCPMGIDLSRIMEALRLQSLRRNQNYIDPRKLPVEDLIELPTIALVSNFRKFTA